ncbi:MAG: hypothetical protein Q4P15_02075 [Propionibacteriaceae bacterium]|nr:hypothetical protein [Propionibacteriaceae bacterium]
MSNDLEFEPETTTGEGSKQWGMHNGIVVLAALGLVALALLLEMVPQMVLAAGIPFWLLSFLSSIGFVLMLAAGSVIGMLVATRMLQAHVGERGARMLALWGIAALVASLMLQAGLLAVRIGLQAQAAIPLDFAITAIQYFVTGTIAVGAAMVALAFVGRLHS